MTNLINTQPPYSTITVGGSGNVFRFRVGPEYFWIAGSGPGGSLTPSEEEHFYCVAQLAGLEWTGDEYMQI
ncbi:hypothetical protein TrVFT333_004477 [Trichoderma virens FT-333]|nr:hypothetical protein TrVFT333_004477 [Trichoderma virens FT-333]